MASAESVEEQVGGHPVTAADPPARRALAIDAAAGLLLAGVLVLALVLLTGGWGLLGVVAVPGLILLLAVPPLWKLAAGRLSRRS